MSDTEDPGAGSESAGPSRPNDELEDWLSDLRTDVSADPPGWITEDSTGAPPAGPAVEPGPVSPGQSGAEAVKPSSGGRHRAPD